MSNTSMLEQAIVDAETLKEAALKSAESTILERYSTEVEKAVNSLLEQEAPMMPPPMPMPMPGEEPLEETEDQFDSVPHAHYQEEALEEDQEVDIDLDKLAEELTRELDEDVLEEDDAETEEEDNDEEAVELTEEQLASIIEKITGLPKNVPTGQAGGASNATLDEENEDIALAQEAQGDEDEDEETKKENKKLKESIKKLQKDKKTLFEQNKKYKNLLVQVKERLEEVNLSNAKLLYTNRVLGSTSLNERQKIKVVEALSKAGSVEESKVIYETLQSAVGSSRKRNPQSLSEAVKRNSSTTIPRRKEGRKSAPLNDRWKTLAGIK